MKKIKFFMQHPRVTDLHTALEYLRIESLMNDFLFIFDNKNPDYLIATEHIYFTEKWKRSFLEYKLTPIKIFFGRELYMPDFNLFDYATSFYDKIECADRYVPLSSADDQYFDWLRCNENDIKTLTAAKEELAKKQAFCNFLYSNGNAHHLRDECFYSLSQYKKVESLGRWLNNVRKKGTGFEGHKLDSIDIKHKYKFSIAFENAVCSGYTTEKIWTSLQAHTVPIYFGNPNISNIINPDCFINCNNLTLEEIKEIVIEIDHDNDRWCKMVSSPWQTVLQLKDREEQNQKYINFWKKIFSQNLSDASRLAIGYHPDNYHKWFSSSKPIFYTNILRKIKNKIAAFIP